jgi:hypothetical protein
MPPHLRRDMAKERRWRGVIANWQASGISITEYCRLHDVPYRDLTNWRRIIRTRDLEQRTASPKVDHRTKKRAGRTQGDAIWPSEKVAQQPDTALQFPRRRQGSVDFAEVQLIDKQKDEEEQSGSDGGVVIEVVLPSGISLRLKAGCPLNFLSSVVSSLENR